MELWALCWVLMTQCWAPRFCLSDPFYWINPGVLALIAVLPVLLLQITVGLAFLCLQRRLRGTGWRVAGWGPFPEVPGLLELGQLTFIFEGLLGSELHNDKFYILPNVNII